MATVILTAVGNAVGGPLGALVGSMLGGAVDQALFGSTVVSEGPRLNDLSVQASSYGQPIPRLWGPENRIAGNLIWSTGLIETKNGGPGGGKGSGVRSSPVTYTYHVDCAIALCRGPIAGVRRIWADGKLFRDEAAQQTQAQAVRIYRGTEDQAPDPLMQAALGPANTPGYRGLAYVVFERLELADFGNRLPNFTFEVEGQAAATVATVIDELCTAADVPYVDAARADRLDVRGYVLARASTIRGALDPLRAAYFFDASEIDGELQFFPSDAPPIVRVPRDRLGAHAFATDRVPDYEARRTADVELPRQVTVQHLDPARDYQVNSQRSRRSTVNSSADLAVDLPLVMDASAAKAVAERMLSMAWLRRDRIALQLPIDYLHIEPGHKLVVGQADGRERVVRVVRRELRLPGVIALECETDGAAVLSKTAAAASALVPSQQVLLPGETVPHLLDLPILRDADDSPGIYLAGNSTSAGWRGAVAYRSRDGGATFESMAALSDRAVIGTTDDALPPASRFVPDEASKVTVSLVDASDTLESVSRASWLAGANTACIGDEIVQFQTAELLGPGHYRLSGLLRGRRGTENAIGGHTAGERFVLLSGPGLVRAGLEPGEVGVERTWKVASVGTSLADASPILFAHGGRYGRPYAPAHLHGSRNSAGDLAISWIRRTRLDAPWIDGVDAPLGELLEAYEVDILDAGDAVRRTLTSSTPSVTYTAAQQTSDFGSVQPAVRVRVQQISSRVGRGLPAEKIL